MNPQQPSIPPKLAEANTAFAAGDVDQAVAFIASALDEQPELPAKVYQVLLGNLMRLKRIEEGVAWAEKAVTRAPDNVEIGNLFALFLHKAGRSTEALQAFDRVLATAPEDRSALTNKGHVLNELNDGGGAEAIFRKLLILDPAASVHQRSLAKALQAQGRNEAATGAIRQALAIDPADVDAWLDLSALIAATGDVIDAIRTLDAAIGRCPGEERLLEAKAIMYRRAGLIDELGPYLNELAEDYADRAWFHSELGQFTARHDRQAANHHFRQAVSLEPASTEYRLALVANLVRTRGVDEGAYLDEAHAILSQLPVAAQRQAARAATEILMLAVDHEGLRKLGSLEDLGRAAAMADHHTALLFQFSRVETGEQRHEIIRQHRDWGDRAKARAAGHPISRPSATRSSSKIRVGFMSSDLREHVVTHFAWPLFEHVDRARFEIYCYSYFRTPEPPPLQRQVSERVDVFRWHPSITDRSAAELIAGDQLDILFELGGSTAMNKLGVMAWKPAPICASWLGYPHSAGLDTIDYFLVDPFLNPPDPEMLIEKPLIMPRSWIAMSEMAFPDEHMIDAMAPVRRNGHVTFGTANNPYKYNAGMLRVWARTVARVPGSRFVFLRPEAGSLVFQRNILSHFEAEGVAAHRIEFRPIRGAHMPLYNDIDIALDTFPQTGGTTTCDALWMGVPTVTLVGDALFERLSYSILQNAGLGDLCAPSTEHYIDIAVALAADTDRLQALRTGLRDQIRASPLGQTRQFAEDFYNLIAKTVSAHDRTAPLP
jgi:protein O-GlcNAc transferase